MLSAIKKWFLALSVRWKLQLGFMLVTMLTTVYSRMLASVEMTRLIDVAKNNNVSEQVLSLLEQRHDQYIFNSFWESGIEFVIQFFIIGFVAKKFIHPILEMRRAAEAIEHGDLTKSVAVESQDEIGQLSDHFNEMRLTLNRIITSVDDSAIHMRQSAFQIAGISNEIKKSANSETERSSAVTSAAMELNEISQQVSDISQETFSQAQQMVVNAQKAISAVESNVNDLKVVSSDFNQLEKRVNNLTREADAITAIITTISDIADQTNLLALNAAIEAARAGESGRGFAVVADEVRGLAARTAKSSDEVSKVIKTLSNQVHNISADIQNLVGRVLSANDGFANTSGSLESIVGGVHMTAELNQKISANTGEQLVQFKVLQTTLEELFNEIAANSKKIGNTVNISDALFDLTDRLHNQMTGLKFERVIEEKPAHHARRHKRIESRLLVRVTLPDGTAVDGLTSDLSISGVSLNLHDRSIYQGDRISIRLTLPQKEHEVANEVPKEYVNLKAKVMSVKRDIERQPEKVTYGLMFLDAEGQKEVLEKCISFYEKKEK